MQKLIISIFLLISSEFYAASQQEELLNRFEKYYRIDHPSRQLNVNNATITFKKYIHEALRKIASTAAGRELIQNIINVYADNRCILCKGNLLLRDVVLKDNICLFLGPELDKKITTEDISDIETRNRLIKRRIKFQLGTDTEFDKTNNTILIGSYINGDFLMPQQVNTMVIQPNGQVVRGIVRPIDVGIFHELLHCFHWMKDPVTFKKLSQYCVIPENKYQCRFMRKSELSFNIHSSWITGDMAGSACNILAIVPYLVNPVLITGPYFPEIATRLFVNIEELLTIRGKNGTMYRNSENKYRLQRGLELRFGHILDLPLGQAVTQDPYLYGEYCNSARRG